jgi:hypothetical protein
MTSILIKTPNVAEAKTMYPKIIITKANELLFVMRDPKIILKKT